MAVRRVAPLLAAALLVGVVATPTASAAPGHPKPTAAQVAAARASAAAAAQVQAQARSAAATAQARLDALDGRLESLVETWNAATATAQAAAGEQTRAQQAAALAQQAVGDAQSDVDRLAAQSYQVGADFSGGLGQWAAVIDSAFTSGGLQGLADRVTAVRQVAADQRHTLDSTSALRLLALQTQEAAVRASVTAASAQRAAQSAADAVRAQQAAQKQEVANLTAELAAATRSLAAARTTATSLAAQRAEALRREAAARAAAAAAAEARRRAWHGGHSSGDVGGDMRPWPDGSSVTTPTQRRAALAWATTQLGKPYVAGADGPGSYDCSGLTSAAYRTVGIALVHYSQSQFASGRKIPIAALQPGDLVFFATDPSDWRTIHHVALYAGGGRMVEAPHTGDVVKFQTIWQSELVAFGARP
jgi:cell wall-associated NlpC family hydrolase